MYLMCILNVIIISINRIFLLSHFEVVENKAHLRNLKIFRNMGMDTEGRKYYKELYNCNYCLN